MTIAATLERALAGHRARYQIVPHPLTGCSTDTAEVAHVPGGHLAKAVVLQDGAAFLMVVLGADRHVDLGKLSAELGRPLEVVREDALAGLFSDCEPGAVPPVGPAYRMGTVVDRELAEEPDVYFEAGDHESLVHMRTDAFLDLLGHPPVAEFSVPI